MNLQLIEGVFDRNDSIELISKMIQTKIKYHENKIEKSYNEEDIKNRESKIKFLQNELFNLRKMILQKDGNTRIDGVINIYSKCELE